ncbi:hypothetical protein IU449_27520 [Nocardia higoensis]|uniref:Uncharacterized protein n=1 Tax=Nocardia higoensis TaxID=228599 RepID=A0ABS0DIG3_9NOCA|nr:hypothetical protein [Nocardia higoensis]MBF6358251.1 hypothetical protein [Nocardia higoensis]
MPESTRPNARLQRLVQAVTYVRAAAALWWIGSMLAADAETATSAVVRALVAALGVAVRILT